MIVWKCSASDLLGNNGCLDIISAKVQPIDQTSRV